MKLFPIKVEPDIPRLTNIVEWMIGNTCNFDCSFCGDPIKSGSQRFFDIAVYTNIIDKVISESKIKKTWFKITGGEPTLFPKLIDLLKYIKEKEQFTYIITNGSRTLRFWQEIKQADCLDILAITYHPEQTNDIQHLLDVIQLFEDSQTVVLVNVTCVPEFFEESTTAFDLVKEKSAAHVNLQQINDEYGMSKYTDIQKEILLNYNYTKTNNYHKKTLQTIPREYSYHSGIIKYIYEDGTEIKDNAIVFIKNQMDNFFGYSCDIGINYVRIVYDKIQRATCGAGEQWSIYDAKIFKETPIMCPNTSCTCTLDMLIPKNRVSKA